MSKPDSDRIGFATLHNPNDALIDIVFVHGLRGHREETWTKGTTLWPKDLLPEKVPQARILAFGYDADIYHFWSRPASDNIKNHADSLTAGLIGLRYGKKQTIARPIIFVAHSLGGLLCAEALSTAENNLQEPHAKTISDCTRRIAFLGTPHQGSDKAQWAEIGKKFLTLLSLKSTGGLLKELEQRSDTLVKLGVAFPQWLSHRAGKPETKVEIICFFEELSSSVGGHSIGKIVPEESARLKVYPALSIYADHCDMCKFSNATDGNYQKVADVLARWAEELKEATKKEDTKPPGDKVTFGANNQGNQFGRYESTGTTNWGTWNAGPS